MACNVLRIKEGYKEAVAVLSRRISSMAGIPERLERWPFSDLVTSIHFAAKEIETVQQDLKQQFARASDVDLEKIETMRQDLKQKFVQASDVDLKNYMEVTFNGLAHPKGGKLGTMLEALAGLLLLRPKYVGFSLGSVCPVPVEYAMVRGSAVKGWIRCLQAELRIYGLDVMLQEQRPIYYLLLAASGLSAAADTKYHAVSASEVALKVLTELACAAPHLQDIVDLVPYASPVAISDIENTLKGLTCLPQANDAVTMIAHWANRGGESTQDSSNSLIASLNSEHSWLSALD